MSYTKQNFTTGQVLKANHLNYIENGISENATAIETNTIDIEVLKADIYQISEDVANIAGTSDEQVQNAVNNYMATNPIEESDPTVPEWAKQPDKPTYTALEVGALPAGTKIPSKMSDLQNDSGYAKTTDIPEKLPANGGNADTVNKHTVESDVPADAIFTDTIYDDTEVKKSINELSGDIGQLSTDMHNYINKRTYGKKLCLIGDSVSSGHLTNGVSWVESLSNLNYFSSIVNRSTSGITLKSVIDNAQNYMADILSSDVVCIELCGNDAMAIKNGTETFTEFSNAVDYLFEQFTDPKFKLIWLLPENAPINNTDRNNIGDFCIEYVKLKCRDNNVQCFGVYNSTTGSIRNNLINSDKVHINNITMNDYVAIHFLQNLISDFTELPRNNILLYSGTDSSLNPYRLTYDNIALFATMGCLVSIYINTNTVTYILYITYIDKTNKEIQWSGSIYADSKSSHIFINLKDTTMSAVIV